MTGMTLQSTVRDRTPVVNAAANVQKAAAKTQGFGDVLGKALQESGQVSEKTSVQIQKTGTDSKKTDTEPKNLDNSVEESSVEKSSMEKSPTETDGKVTESETKDAEMENVSDEGDAAEEKAVDAAPVQENAPETGEVTDTKAVVEKETVDEMTVDEIARALEQIIEQIKQILGIKDEELLAGMEKAGMTQFDLLNSDNMTKLVTAVSGNESAISLAADEKLYAALQDISGMVEAKVGELLDKTGLTGDELEIVMAKLKEMENAQPGTSVPEQKQAPDTVLVENQTDMEPVTKTAKPIFEGPVVIKEDNTKPAKQYDTLPENQQENPTETLAASKTQNTQRETRQDDGREPKQFGQDGAQPNFQNSMGEVHGTVAAEGLSKFVSESTENILRQLADMVKIARNENLTEMEMQLHPASLGTVNVSLTSKGGAVTAHFTAQNETVKAAIESQVVQLQTKLEAQGIKVEAVEVSVASHEMERNLDKDGRDQQRSEQESAQRIQGSRRRSINLRSLEEGGELTEELSGDDAARIAMEIMTANGNSMDLLA